MIEFVCSSENDSDIFMKNVTSETFSRHSEKLIWTKEEYETEAETRILSTGRVLKGIEYNSSKKSKRVMTTESTEDCESDNKNTEVENEKKVSFDNVTNVG